MAMKSVKKKIKEVESSSQHWDLPELIGKRVNPILRGWGNYFKTGNSRKHFLSVANYTVWTLCIMLRKKHKKRGKGWRDHPPSWFYDYHGLLKLYSLSVTGDVGKRLLDLCHCKAVGRRQSESRVRENCKPLT